LTKTIDGFKVKGASLAALRGSFFKILTICITNNAGNPKAFVEDVTSVVRYLLHTSSLASKIEIFHFLFRLFDSNPEMSPWILHGFARCKFVLALISMHSHANAKIRIFSLVMFCKILSLSSTVKTLPNMPKSSSSSSSEKSNRSAAFQDNNRESLSLKAIVTNYAERMSLSSPIPPPPMSSSPFQSTPPRSHPKTLASSSSSTEDENGESDSTLEALGLSLSAMPSILNCVTDKLLAALTSNDVSSQ
jgi:hypothetical protein